MSAGPESKGKLMPGDALQRRTELPRPDVTAEDAAAILRQHFGIEGPLKELGSQQDRNYRVDAPQGRFVLKICLADYALEELEAQNAAMRHIRDKLGAPLVPSVVPSLEGEEIVAVEVRGLACRVRLLTYLDGEPLTGRKYLARPSIEALGSLSAGLALALSDFSHPGLERELQWDLRRAGPVVLHLLTDMPEPIRKKRIADAMVAAMRRLQPLSTDLRQQAIHHDVTDDNVVSHADRHGRLIPVGVIDFGDVITGWLVADLAVTCACLLHHADGDPFVILPAIRAFHDACPLTEAEISALWPLIVARACVLVASSERQIAVDPDNDYVLGNIAHERAIFDTALSVPMALMEIAIRQALGMAREVRAPAATAPMLPDLSQRSLVLSDFSILSPDFAGGSKTDTETAPDEAGNPPVVATRYGEYRLTRTHTLSPRQPDTFALFVDIALPAGTSVVAPFAGTVRLIGERLVLVGPEMALFLSGLSTTHVHGTAVEAGQGLGVTGDETALRLQLCREPGLVPPPFVIPAHAAAWSVLCPSPTALIGQDCDAPSPDNAGLLESRQRHFARPQKHYYEHPPRIERGWREHMFDVEGRSYLDMLNNVTILGHGHPKLAEAVWRQWSMLNTNSRFHYASVAEFSERLASLAPEGLDTVFLVNSGSEANDLALRLAWAATGARNMLCLLEGYHGWSVASDAVSTSIADNPQALSTRPSWVHPVVSPNTYRGPYRGAGTTADYVATVAPVLDELEARGEALAGFICEPVYGNAGGIALPEGYLEAVYAMVRERGGLCIADEVQVGYGRLGHFFWGFEQQGVVPDIICTAKGMGNGHPLGAVITTRAIADALEREGYFFSSSGGSPVSCVVGMTVLDILEAEGLQKNAATVGDHLKARLEALGERFPIVGAVHGMGLYLGVEFVRDRDTLAPATEETAAICDRLLQLGVLMQPTGDYLNVLKIKPPLCLTRDSADFFADMLARVLEEGW